MEQKKYLKSVNIGIFRLDVNGINIKNIFLKSMPNWTGVVPEKDDYIVLHAGDNNEEEIIYQVKMKIVNFAEPGYIRLLVERSKTMFVSQYDVFRDWPDSDDTKRI